MQFYKGQPRPFSIIYCIHECNMDQELADAVWARVDSLRRFHGFQRQRSTALSISGTKVCIPAWKRVDVTSNICSNIRTGTYLIKAGWLAVMLKEDKISRPRPRLRPGSWGRDRGQSFEVEAEANFLRSRPRPRPKIKLWIKSIKWWLTTYRRIYIIMIKTTQFISHSLSHSNYLLS